MQLDVIIDACKAEAQDFIGTLNNLDELVPDDMWTLLNQRFGKDTYTRLVEFENLTHKTS